MRKFMVIMDDSSEFLNALYFAALRAEKTKSGVVVLAVIDPSEFQHWLGVGEAMREEADERIHAHFEVFCKWMEGRVHIRPELTIRNGKIVDEALAAIAEDPDIRVLVLGASSDAKGPGKLIESLVVKRGVKMPVPLTIVPGGMSHDEIKAIC